MPFGLVDTQFINFPVDQTAGRLAGLQNRLNIDWLEFVRRVDGGLAALNSTSPVADLFSFDTTLDVRRAAGQADKVWHRSAEYTPGRPQRGMSERGHYLPLYHYEIDMMFTDRSLQTITIPQFEDELRTTFQAVAKGREADVLERLFDNAEVPLDDDGNGGSPGFAGSGTGNNAFIGNLPNGAYTDASYTHYFNALDTDAAIHSMILAMRTNMAKWQNGPFDIYGSPAAINRIKAIPGGDAYFVSAGSSLIRPGVLQSEALVDSNLYEGVYAGNIRVRYADLSIDGNAFVMFKAGTKPLAWRYDPIWGRSAYADDRRVMPLTETAIMQSYGVGVWDRTGAAVASIAGAGGVYAKPAIFR